MPATLSISDDDVPTRVPLCSSMIWTQVARTRQSGKILHRDDGRPAAVFNVQTTASAAVAVHDR